MKDDVERKDAILNLPPELLRQPRFFPVGKKKSSVPIGWSNPDNQKLFSELNNPLHFGFDICGHGRNPDYALFDFDNCLDDNSNFINREAETCFNSIVLKLMPVYIERSKSNHGLHIIAQPSPGVFSPISNGKNGVLYFDRANGTKLEIFYATAARYCLLTGNTFQNSQPVIPKGAVVDDILHGLLNEIQKRLKNELPKQEKNLAILFDDSFDYDFFRAHRMIEDFIPLRDLEGSDWLATMSALKNLGFSYSEVDRLNQGGKHYDENENLKRWNSLNDSSYDIETLHGIAKRFGYDEKSVWHEYHDKQSVTKSAVPHDTSCDQWQVDNGAIEPKLLTKLKSEAERIKNISDFAAAASDTTTQKFLGAFQYYSFLAPIAEKFFINLKRKKEEISKKIREYESLKKCEPLYVQNNNQSQLDKIASLSPSDSDLALTNINITALKNKVSTFETAVRKAHRKYLDQKVIDELNAKYQAERKAYQDDPPSTLKNIPDCPVDLILPLGVYFDKDKGIRIVDFDKPVGSKGRPVIEACQNLIVPIRAFREVSKRGENPKSKDQYEIAIQMPKYWRRVIVDARTLQDPRSISALSDFGAHITDPKFLAKYFAKIIALNELNGKLPVVKVYLQPGWQDRDFKFFAHPDGGDNYIVKNGDFDYSYIFTPRGDKIAWQNMLRRVIYHSPKSYSPDDISAPCNFSSKPNLVAAMILGSTFGAPLVAPLGVRNPQMVLGFDSGNGKTAAAKFATSFFGDPSELCPTCNATENFLEDLAVKLNDFPHAVDELQAAKKHVRENMDELVYKFSGGTTRGRADIQGNAKPTFHYRGFRLFTGEQAIINDNSGQGAISRIFEIHKAELFADQFAIEIHNFTQDNFGFFGKSYTTDFIPKNLERIRKQFSSFRDAFSSNSFKLLSSHSTFLAYALTGLQFGLEATGFSEQEALDITFSVLEDIDSLIADAPTKHNAANKVRALRDLPDFVDAHPKEFIREVTHDDNGNSVKYLTPAEGNRTLGIKLADGKIAFNPLMLKKIIGEELNYPSASQIINAFGESGYFDCESNEHKKFKKRLPSWMAERLGKNSWFYILKSPEELAKITAA